MLADGFVEMRSHQVHHHAPTAAYYHKLAHQFTLQHSMYGLIAQQVVMPLDKMHPLVHLLPTALESCADLAVDHQPTHFDLSLTNCINRW
jgi:hypothetical protein